MRMMTLVELKDLMSDGDQSTDMIARHSEDARVIIAWRADSHAFLPFEAGTRMDVRCEVCEERVALSLRAQSKLKSGARIDMPAVL